MNRPSSPTPTQLNALRTWIESLPGVSSGPHRFGGLEYTVDRLEFMHFHGQTHLDIRLSKTDQAEVLASDKAEPHLFAPQAGWVTLRIKSGEDVSRAMEVIKLAYDHASSVVNDHQKRRAGTK